MRLILVSILLISFLGSCKKEYTCECTNRNLIPGKGYEVVHTFKYKTKESGWKHVIPCDNYALEHNKGKQEGEYIDCAPKY